MKTPEPRLILKTGVEKHEAQVSYLVPVFNHGTVIEEVIISLIESASLPFEILILDDASTDGSAHIAKGLLQRLWEEKRSPFFVAAKVWRASYPLFEAASDNFLASQATADVLIEVQADILIQDFGFDKRAKDKLDSNPSLVMISGRGGHSLEIAQSAYSDCLGTPVAVGKSLVFFIFRRILLRIGDPLLRLVRREGREASQLEGKSPEGVGRIGTDFFSLPDHIEHDTSAITVETVIRGPLVIRASLFWPVGGFNTARFFLGFDDHDFCARARNQGLEVAYLPCRAYSRPGDGATRRPRPWRHELALWGKLIAVRTSRKRPLGVG